jgi:hypothetical protein
MVWSLIMLLQVTKAKPSDVDAKLKYAECSKIVKQMAFERAIRVDDTKRSIADSINLDNMGNCCGTNTWVYLCVVLCCVMSFCAVSVTRCLFQWLKKSTMVQSWKMGRWPWSLWNSSWRHTKSRESCIADMHIRWALIAHITSLSLSLSHCHSQAWICSFKMLCFITCIYIVCSLLNAIIALFLILPVHLLSFPYRNGLTSTWQDYCY